MLFRSEDGRRNGRYCVISRNALYASSKLFDNLPYYAHFRERFRTVNIDSLMYRTFNPESSVQVADGLLACRLVVVVCRNFGSNQNGRLYLL